MSTQTFSLEQESFPAEPTRVDWTDEDIDTLYEGLLFRSLQQLFNPHSSVELRIDVNSWIFDEPLHGPKGKPRAFSFESCCRWFAVDPVEVRSQILNLMIRTGVMDLIDENRMAVADKRRASSKASRPSIVQLGFFEDDDTVFSPMSLKMPPRKRASHEPRSFEAFLDVMQRELF